MRQKAGKRTKLLYQQLDKVFHGAPRIPLETHPGWVIFSDLHIGDGGSTDDFKRNAELFSIVVNDFYKKNGSAMVLNGDVEELLRFSVNKITSRWKDIYALFDWFAEKDRFFKTIGNHDLELPLMKEELPFQYPLHEGIRLSHGDNDVFIFHGHQASKKFQEHQELIGFTLKYFANPLGIKNYSVSHSSKKQYKIEKQVYQYSAFNKVVSIIGHTHRPLFESMHKVERLKFKIEQLCRDYTQTNGEAAEEIRSSIKTNKKELKRYYRQNIDHNYQNYVYNSMFQIPCLFNSGCVVGKRGMTCLEIEGDTIRLVHWFDKKMSKKYLQQSGYEPQQLGDSDIYRMVINEESLNYIFTRINFLA